MLQASDLANEHALLKDGQVVCEKIQYSIENFMNKHNDHNSKQWILEGFK